MKVLEVFKSIQGEGFNMGLPATFVRFAGCNLSCPWCDTKESWDDSNTTDYALEDLVSEILKQETEIVVLTGGEPTLQEQLPDLIDFLNLHEKIICIETNGTNEVPSGINWVAVSPKPQSDYRINTLCNPDELKYVVTEDFDAKYAIPESIRALYPGRIWLQPDGYNLTAMRQKAYDLAQEDPRLRVGVQLHKIMEVR